MPPAPGRHRLPHQGSATAKPHGKWKDRKGTRQERGYGAEYMRNRNVVMQVNNQGRPMALCRMCLERENRPTQATECDHIIPKSAGGSDDVENLQPICRACHKRKTAREAAEARGHQPRQAIGLDGWPIE